MLAGCELRADVERLVLNCNSSCESGGVKESSQDGAIEPFHSIIEEEFQRPLKLWYTGMRVLSHNQTMSASEFCATLKVSNAE